MKLFRGSDVVEFNAATTAFSYLFHIRENPLPIEVYF
jgi:hypothetical protein